MKTYASLRFQGTHLNPNEITEILHEAPTVGYKKGEIYIKSHGHKIHGRTGLWLLSSEGHVDSDDLIDHLRYLLMVISEPEKMNRLRHLMRDGHIEADVGCFWYGAHGTSPPVIPPEIRKVFSRIPAYIEPDFYEAKRQDKAS